MNADSKSSISTVVADMQSSDAAVVADLKSSDAVMVVVVRMRETPDHTLTRTFGWRPGTPNNIKYMFLSPKKYRKILENAEKMRVLGGC